MGQYLSVGIVTRIIVSRERVVQRFKSVDDFKVAFDKEFNANGIYNLRETDSDFFLELKPEIAEMEWVEFIRAFYELCYAGAKDHSDVLEALSKESTLEAWLAIAEDKKFYDYQADDYMESYPLESPDHYRSLYVNMEQVILAIDGKIIMESYRGMFNFFARSIRKCLSDYRLSDSLFVSITG